VVRYEEDVAARVALCDTCHWVKPEHHRPVGLLQPLKVPEWKWEEIRMDFIVGLPRTQDGYDSIWVIVSFDQGCSLHSGENHLYGS
jgi:hypothetical protein